MRWKVLLSLQHGWAGDCSLFYISQLYYDFVLIINVPLSPHLPTEPSPFVRGWSLKGGGRPEAAKKFLPPPSAPLLSATLPCSALVPGSCSLCQPGTVGDAWQHQGTPACPVWVQLCSPSPCTLQRSFGCLCCRCFPWE